MLIDQLHRMAPDRAFISFVEPQNIASMGLLRKLEYRDMDYVPETESQMFGKWTNELKRRVKSPDQIGWLFLIKRKMLVIWICM